MAKHSPQALPRDPHQSLKLIAGLRFCVFDLETTGPNCQSDKIIEIGMVQIENLKIVKKKNFLINPGIKIPDFIQKLTGIKQSKVKKHPPIENCIDEILEFMQDRILVAHNTSFDIPFFNSVLERLGHKPLKNKSICTNVMTKYMIPNLLNSNLHYMSKIFEIPHEGTHRALDDAHATAQLFLIYLQAFIDRGIPKINHLYYPGHRYQLDQMGLERTSEFGPKEALARLKFIVGQSMSQARPCPFRIVLQNAQGAVLFALPCQGTKTETEFISQKIQQLDWKTITFKLYGPFLENLIHFFSFFDKLRPKMREEVMNFLWQQHLPRPVSATSYQTQVRELGDFVTTHHFVPEQMLIFPTRALKLKHQLIYRYPGHEKKLLQYIRSKSTYLSRHKPRENRHPLKIFIESYLFEHNSKDDGLFTFKKQLPAQHPQKFFKQIEGLAIHRPNSYSYPREHFWN